MDTDAVIRKARQELEQGQYAEALELLRPSIDKHVPEALFLSSTFSVGDTESDMEFETRSIEQLHAAAEGGYVPAIYNLGIRYELGDMVDQDLLRAGCLIKSAADAGYPAAKLSHGINLYFGTVGVDKDETQGVKLILEADNDGVEGAREFIVEHNLAPRGD